MSIKHYRYGGSTWGRTLACPGWRRMADRVIDRPRSQAAADRGTLLHSAVMEMYRSRLRAERMVGYTCPEVKGQSVTSRDAKAALIPAHTALVKFMGKIRPRFEVEVRYTPLAGGTADALARAQGKLVDFKFGSQRVRARGNSQLLFYAAAYPWPRELNALKLAIIQPGMRPLLDVSFVTRKVIDAYRQRVPRLVHDAEHGPMTLNKGPHCDYCPVKPICPAYNGDLKLLDPARLPASGFFNRK